MAIDEIKIAPASLDGEGEEEKKEEETPATEPQTEETGV